jgi:hypothetical protein
MANSSNSSELKQLEDYASETWYPTVMRIIDCNYYRQPMKYLNEAEFHNLQIAYNIAEQQNNLSFDLQEPCDAHWPYILGFMLYYYSEKKYYGIYYLLSASMGPKDLRCAAALHLLGLISMKKKLNKYASMFFVLASASGCTLSESSLKKNAVNFAEAYRKRFDNYEITDKKPLLKEMVTPEEYRLIYPSGGRRSLRKKRTLHNKRRKNRTKQSAHRKF